eukprot:6157706-Pyramimonas_sp.AAC.1
MNQERAKDAITGRRRIITVRSHVRVGETMCRWLPCACGVPRHVAIVRFLDYAHAMAAEPCGPTVPNQALRA